MTARGLCDEVIYKMIGLNYSPWLTIESVNQSAQLNFERIRNHPLMTLLTKLCPAPTIPVDLGRFNDALCL
jgi:hypothetical protein